ncbi:MAG: hypothetical protein ACTHJZ_19115 [Trinickia sp.]|uniref:hypothetical protein n=1 Tax=Trinickia sp. TaxID=2571163 RepID=UPI003F7EBE23
MRKKRDLLAVDDLETLELLKIIERAQDMAKLWKERRMPQSLTHKRIGLVVNDTGWRNTTAFDLGIQAMGGICVHSPVRWDTREALNDLATYLDNWFDGIVTRTPDLSTLRTLADLSHGPVINAAHDTTTRARRSAISPFTFIDTARLTGSRWALFLLSRTFSGHGSRQRQLYP